MIEGKWIAPGKDIRQAISIREKVLGLGADALDAFSWNAVIYHDGLPCATGRIRYDAGVFMLEHICTLPAHRGQGMGDVLTRLLLFKARQHAARTVRIHCQASLMPFFARYGFAQDEPGSMALSGECLLEGGCKGCSKSGCVKG